MFKHDGALLTGALAALAAWTFNRGAPGERFGATLASGKVGVADGAPLLFGAPDAASGGKSAAGTVYSYQRFASTANLRAEIPGRGRRGPPG